MLLFYCVTPLSHNHMRLRSEQVEVITEGCRYFCLEIQQVSKISRFGKNYQMDTSKQNFTFLYKFVTDLVIHDLINHNSPTEMDTCICDESVNKERRDEGPE